MYNETIGLFKHLFYNITDLIEYLEDIGFTITNNKILWNNAESDTACYWTINNNIINLRRSDGQMAFTKNLVDFDYEEIIEGETITRPVCATVYMPLENGGLALYLGMITEDTFLDDVTFSCANTDEILNNGLVVLSPAEDDGHWYYGWNHPNSTETFYWCLDNGHNSYQYGTNVNQIAPKEIYSTALSFSMARVYLNTGYWSKNFKELITGNLNPPGFVFKMKGQKYVLFTNNTSYRAPCYKLPEENVQINLTTSTEPYSSVKTYKQGDYCTYEGFLYKCIIDINIPEPFDENHWTQTTVHNELIDQGNNIYGD